MTQQTQIGVRANRMKPLTLAMIMAFSEHYGTRIFPHLRSAIISPVYKHDLKDGRLVRKDGTNLYLPVI
ncbi:MAG: hypothetical protein E6R08_06215 [Nevskiaceae bacterium]|nr:MAG: hypothetical protein E6R08_06215 [Nevskiaceae bacterium]